MELVNILASVEGRETFPLVIPKEAFAAIAASFFLFLGLVTYSFRNVANRHSEKWSDASDNAHH